MDGGCKIDVSPVERGGPLMWSAGKAAVWSNKAISAAFGTGIVRNEYIVRKLRWPNHDSRFQRHRTVQL